MKNRIWLFFFLFPFLAIATTNVLAIPLYQDSRLSVANNTEYKPDRGNNAYGFQINWTDSAGAYATVTSVKLQANFNGTTLNYTAISNNTVGIYWANFTYKTNITNAETLYSYRWYADNVTTGFENATVLTTYYIAKNTSSIVCMNISVYAIGGGLSDTCNANAQSYQGQGNPYANCWMGLVGSCGAEPTPSWGTTYLYRDGATWTKGSSGATSLSAASYTVKCNSTGNVNYTDNSTGSSYTLTILTSGGGGGYDPTITTTTPTTTQPVWQTPEGWSIDSKWIWIAVILIVIYAFSKRKK